MNIITIDCGASFIKGTLYKDDEEIRHLEVPSPRVSEYVLNPVQIYKVTDEVKRIVKDLSEGLDTAGLSISNEMHGFVIADKDGKCVTDHISWQKEYGHIKAGDKTAIERLSESDSKDDIIKTGMPLRAGFPSVNLYYLLLSDKLKLSVDKEYYLYTLGDYIIRDISGIKPMMHSTNAAGTGFYDVTTGKWNEVLVKKIIGDNPIVLPAIGTDTVSFKAFNTDFTTLPAIGDQQAALLGAGLKNKGEVSFNIGTGGQVSVLADKPDFSDNYQIRPYFNGTFIKTIPFIPSGRALNVYLRFVKDILSAYGLDKDDKEIWEGILSQVGKGQNTSSSMTFELGFFDNAFSKANTGAIDNIGEYDLTLGYLFDGVFEKIADNYIKAYRNVTADINDSFDTVIFSGGIARRISFIRDGILKEFDKDIKVVTAVNETSVGLKEYFKENAGE